MKNKIKYMVCGVCTACFLCGCYAPKALDENYFCLSEVKFIEPGVLELNGEYGEIAWGISELRGKVDGETLTLSGMVEYWGDDTIQHRITVPAHVNIVKCGSKVLWRRGDGAAAAVENEETDRDSETAPQASLSQPASAPETEVSPAQPSVDRSQITHLKIGGASFNIFTPRWLTFEEIFWGALPSAAVPTDGVLQFGADHAIYNFNGQFLNEFSNLEVLEIRGTTYIRHADLTGLSLPKLRRLVLDQVEVTGLESVDLPLLEEFYLNDMRTVPLGAVSLPERLEKLHTVGIQAYAGNFDFASLRNKPVRSLRIISDCREFGFLSGMPLTHLQMSGFSAENGALDVLGTLPLESLMLKPFRPLGDWSFLSRLHLKSLSVRVVHSRAFSLDLLQHMPLEVLRLQGLTAECDAAWNRCSNLPLKELVLFNCRVPETFLRSKPIENVALYQCFWSSANPFDLLNVLPGVRHLAVWRIYQWHSGRQYRMIDRELNWENFVGRGVESLCISAGDLNFLRKFPGVKKVIIRDVAAPLKLENLQGREFEIFTLPLVHQQEIMRFNIKISGAKRFEMLTADW